MKLKKFLAVLITLAMLASMAFVFNVSADGGVSSAAAEPTPITPMPMPTVPVIPQDSNYACAEGTITEIKDYIGADGKAVEGKQILSIEQDENKFTAVIDSNTYSIFIGKTDRKAMSVGDDIRVFYDSKSPMLMIYPPQYNAEFIALNLDKAKSITIARFDLNYTSLNDSLKLNISDDTEIVYQDGTKFEGDPADLLNPSRKLVVIYSVTTKSIPAQTTPEKIIIMYEKAVAPIYTLTDEDKAAYAKAFENADIVLNRTVLENAPKAYMTDGGVLMVPFRAVAEGIGFEVSWIDKTQTVNMGRSLTFSIGKDEYKFSGHDPISLGTSPVLYNDRTYVPFSLFENMPFGKVIAEYYFTEGTLNIEIHIPAAAG